MNQRVLTTIKQKAQDKALEKAEELQSIALDLHRTTARDLFTGRSFAGNAPAIDTGNLYSEMSKPLIFNADDSIDVTVNYVVLEFGFAPNNLQPRPMGRLSLAELKNG